MVSVGVRILPDTTLARYFRPRVGHDGWRVFRAAFPRAGSGIVTVSRAGLSSDRTWAITYIDNQGDWLAGAGYLVVLHKMDGIWHRGATLTLRVS